MAIAGVALAAAPDATQRLLEECSNTAAAGPDRFQRALQSGWVVALGLVFMWGVLTSLTPCVYPMIPIVLSIFGAKGKDVSRRRGMLLALTYVGGMAIMYSSLGVIFALTGRETEFGSFLGNPWVVIPMVGFYVALAGSMFGFFTFDLPLSVRNRLATVGGKGFGGAFAMGLVGGLTAAPCTGPSLLSLLAFVARTGDPLIGSIVLFTFALGMGLLFFIVGTFAVSLPKSGRWMEGVKSFGGIALLVMAIYFLLPVIPALRGLASVEYWYATAAAMALVVGIVLGAIHLTFSGPLLSKLRKGTGILLVTAGAVALILWATTPRRKITWVTEAEGRTMASSQKRPIVVDFAAKWCAPCAEFEVKTFADPKVYEAMQQFVTIKIDATKSTDEIKKLKKKYGAETLPTVVVLDHTGKELARAKSFMGPGEFLGLLRRATDCARAGSAIASRGAN